MMITSQIWSSWDFPYIINTGDYFSGNCGMVFKIKLLHDIVAVVKKTQNVKTIIAQYILLKRPKLL